MSYGTISISASVVNATSATLNWSVASATGNWTATFSGPGTLSVTSQSGTPSGGSGTISVTGLNPSTAYGPWTISLSGGAGTGSANSNNITTQGYSSPNSVTLSANSYTSTSPTITFGASYSGTPTYPVTMTGGTLTQTPTGSSVATGASGTYAASLSYGASYTFSYSYTWTSNGYSGIGFATDITVTTPYLVTWSYAPNGTGSPANVTVTSGGTTTTPIATGTGYYNFSYWRNTTNTSIDQSLGQGATTSAITGNWTYQAYYTYNPPPSYPPAGLSGTLGNGQVNTAYSASVTTTNMNYSGTWSSGGTLPPGLSLSNTAGSNTNTLSGTPTTSGTYNFSITATNSYGSTTSNYAITIAAPTTFPPTWSDNVLGSFVVNKAYSDGVTATNMASYSGVYSISAGTLPTGISYSSTTGAITGTPTVPGPYSFTITATNTYGSISQAFSGNVLGGMAYYDGAAWTKKVANVYSGSAWVAGTVYVYDGASWVPSQ